MKPAPRSAETKIESEQDITDLLRASPFHMQALKAVKALNLPQGWIAAGFVRNYIWDCMHGYQEMTPLNDIDVIYYDAGHLDEAFEKRQEERLDELMPGQPWSVKNQGRMHVKNDDQPYRSIEDALEHWCETVTPIGVRIGANDTLEVLAPLGLEDLLQQNCRATPFARSKPLKLNDYRTRMQEKKWWGIWPDVTVHDL